MSSQPAAISAPLVSVTGSSTGTVTAGQGLTIQCLAVVTDSSLPSVDVTWIGPEGMSLSSEMGVTFSREDELDGSSSLTTYSVHFDAVRTSHAGIFTCVAVLQSAYGTIEVSSNETFSITVQCKYDPVYIPLYWVQLLCSGNYQYAELYDPVCHEHSM